MSEEPDQKGHGDTIALVSKIVAAYVGNNKVGSDELPKLLSDVYGAVLGLSESGQPFAPQSKPAVPVSKSVTPDYLICLEDGKKLKMLKRYLRTHFDMSPEDYRRKWGLDADYPMTAPNYAKVRSRVAKQTGLGKSQGADKTPRKSTKKRSTRGK